MANVLVVYPDTSIRSLLARLFHERGHQVLLLRNSETLAQFPADRDRFDFVLFGDLKVTESERLIAALPPGTKFGWILPEGKYPPERRMWGEFVVNQPFRASEVIERIEGLFAE